MNSINIALFGLGRIGKIHLNILTSCRKVGVRFVVEKDEFVPQAEKYLVAEGYNFSVVSKLEEAQADASQFCLIPSSLGNQLLESSFINAVYVCTPTDQHEDIVLHALKNKKAVFCEKPLAKSLKATIKCYQIALKNQVPLLVAFNRRFDPQLVECERKVAHSDVGKIFQIRTVARDNPRPSYEYLAISGGIFHDCAVHDMDLCRFIAQSQNFEVESVYVTAYCFDEKIKAMNDVDTVNIVMEFSSNGSPADNLHCSIDLSRHGGYGYDQRCEIFAEKGLLSSENVRDSFIQHSQARNFPDGSFNHQFGTALAPVQYSFNDRYLSSYTQELYHFIDLLKSPADTVNRVQAADTLISCLLCDCAEHAHATRSRVNFNQFVEDETLKLLGRKYSVEDFKNNFEQIHEM